MSTRVIINIDPGEIKKDFKNSFNKARMMVKSEIAKDCSPLVPFRQGMLQRSVIPSINAFDRYITWNLPYAKFLYHGKVMVGVESGRTWAKFNEEKVVTSRNIKYFKGHNAQAGPFWFERAKEKKLNKWLKIYAIGAKRLGVK